MLDRKKKFRDEVPPEDIETEKIDVTSLSDTEPKSIDAPAQPLYQKVHWKGNTYTHVCTKCFTNIFDQDDMILHVVKHFPDSQQPAMLDKLLKEK